MTETLRTDPITELFRSLTSTGKPTLAWVVRWSEGGHDPVAAAWRVSWTPTDMARVLERVSHAALPVVHEILRAPALWASTDIDVARSAAIRRLVPVPPTLTELMEQGARMLQWVPGVTRLSVQPVA